jgi:hypothetical protein
MVGRLIVMDEADQAQGGRYRQTQLADTSVTFRACATVINIALSMLETPAGRARLISIGQMIVTGRDHFDHIYEDSPRNMGWWVDLFLERLRASFPSVLLTNRIGGEGVASRANWARGGIKMRQWDPPKAGLMKLNKKVP